MKQTDFSVSTLRMNMIKINVFHSSEIDMPINTNISNDLPSAPGHRKQRFLIFLKKILFL